MRGTALFSTLSILWLMACGNGGSDAGTATAEDGALEAGSSVAQAAIDAWTENAEGVSGYTVTLETDGQESTDTYVKETVDGLPVFVPEGAEPGARDAMTQFPQLLAAAREQGTGSVDGEETDVLVVDDAATLTRIFAMEGGPFRPVRMEIHVGRSDHLMRQIEITGETTIPGGESREVTTIVTLGDWRTVDGFAYPWRTSTSTEGLSDLVQGSTADIDAAAAEFERQLAELPESQREAARQAMGSRFEAARQAASGDPLRTVIVVKDLQVRR